MRNLTLPAATLRLATLAIAGLFALAGPAPAQTATDHAHMDHGDTADTPAVQDYRAAMDHMMSDMMVPYTGDPDVDFVQGMIPHHQAAVAMAKVVLEHGKDPEVRALAESILAAQEAEIALMQAWLAARGR